MVFVTFATKIQLLCSKPKGYFSGCYVFCLKYNRYYSDAFFFKSRSEGKKTKTSYKQVLLVSNLTVKVRTFTVKSIDNGGALEIQTIEKEFSLINPNFKKEWNDQNPPSQGESYSSLAHVKKVIYNYPSSFLKLTNKFLLTSFTYGHFLRTRDFKKVGIENHILYLTEYYSLEDLNFVLQHYTYIEALYKKHYKIYLFQNNIIEFSKIDFRYIQTSFAGTNHYLSNLKTSLLNLVEKIKLKKEDTMLSAHFTNHIYTESLFFMPFHQNCLYRNENNGFPLIFDNGRCTYTDMPLGLVSYLTSNLYNAIYYKEDLLDILYQFFKMNNFFKESTSDILKFKNFQCFVENKNQFLERWSEDYCVTKEYIIFCLEQFLKGKFADFQPIIALYDLEKKNINIRAPKISQILTSLQTEIYPFMLSFNYRECDLRKILNYGKLSNDVVDHPPVAAFGFVDPVNAKDAYDLAVQYKQDLMFQKSNKLTFEDLGLSKNEFSNFNNFLILIQKQIQSEIFKELIAIFPKILLVIDGKYRFKFFYVNRHSNIFFLEKEVFNSPRSDINNLFFYLEERIQNNTGYKLTFNNYDLRLEKKKFQEGVIREFINEFCSIKNTNKFLEFHSGFILSFIELEYIIEKTFSNLPLRSLTSIKRKIVINLKNSGFTVVNQRVNFENRLILLNYAKKKFSFHHKTSIVTKCVLGARLKDNIEQLI